MAWSKLRDANMVINKEYELTGYDLGETRYVPGELLSLQDIAYDLVHTIQDWSWHGKNASKELSELLTPSVLDFQNLHYCYRENDEYVMLGNCSKVFSRSVLTLSEIFRDVKGHIYFLLNECVVYKADDLRIPFSKKSTPLTEAERIVSEKEAEVLQQVVSCFEHETRLLLITDYERLSREIDLYTFHLPYIKYKWGIQPNDLLHTPLFGLPPMED